MPEGSSKSSLAWNYFQKYSGSDAREMLLTLRDRSETESEHLDFKLWNQDQNKIESDFSRSMCAFANTGGGVLVWGVKTKTIARRDTVIESPGLGNLATNVAWLEERKKFISDPPITGIQIVPIETEADHGFIVCYVPEGNNKPYRAEKDKQQWYMRVGDESSIIPPSHLRQLFFPERSIQLRMSILRNHDEPFKSTLEMAGQNPHSVVWRVSILNVGNQSMQGGLIRATRGRELFTWINKEGSPTPTFEAWYSPIHIGHDLHPWQGFHFKLGIKFRDQINSLRIDVLSKDAWPQSVTLRNGEKLQSEIEFPLVPTPFKGTHIIDVEEEEMRQNVALDDSEDGQT